MAWPDLRYINRLPVNAAPRYFPHDPPARIFVCIPEWTGPFDVEIDCIAMV